MKYCQASQSCQMKLKYFVLKPFIFKSSANIEKVREPEKFMNAHN
jgi:hypothetical protein